jgi:hypothetical protein
VGATCGRQLVLPCSTPPTGAAGAVEPAGHNPPERLGVQPRPQVGRADHVAEHHRDRLAGLALAGRRVERRPAAQAEPGSRRVLLAAARTGHHACSLRPAASARVRNLDGIPDGHSSSVQQCPRQDRCGAARVAELAMSTGHDHAHLCGRGRGCDSSVPGPRPARVTQVAGPRRRPRGDHSVSALVARVREAAGTCPGGRSPWTPAWPPTQPGQVCRTPTVRTAVVREAADGQSADHSDSL